MEVSCLAYGLGVLRVLAWQNQGQLGHSTQLGTCKDGKNTDGKYWDRKQTGIMNCIKLDYKLTGEGQAKPTYGPNWIGGGTTGRNTERSQEEGAKWGRVGKRTGGWSRLAGQQVGGVEWGRAGQTETRRGDREGKQTRNRNSAANTKIP